MDGLLQDMGPVAADPKTRDPGARQTPSPNDVKFSIGYLLPPLQKRIHQVSMHDQDCLT